MTAYDRLTARFGRIATINEASSLLGWDAAAMMPPGGGATRGDQLAVLAGLAHGLLARPEVADDLAEAEAAGGEADPWRAANLRLMRHSYTSATALPAALVEAQARANSACEKVWREARRHADFALVAGHLEPVVRLAREVAAALGEALGLTPYDALMDSYQRGLRAADVAPVFAAYEGFLGRALPAAEERQRRHPAPVAPAGPFPVAAQEAFCRRLAEHLGLDFEHARLDRSEHPFSGGTRCDVRITTRYDEADFTQAVLAVVHEVGHALYEQGLPAAFVRQPVGEAAGTAAHESQSLLLERQICRSDQFLSWLGPELRAAFGDDAPLYECGNLGRLWRRVTRGFIRVEADELTYPAHVILRFRLEQALISGELTVPDLPAAWNEASLGLLEISPPDDACGCLQDVHWYDGVFGYFPNYTLGAMAAAQLMAAAERAIPDLSLALTRGDLSSLLAWLRSKFHSAGSRLEFNELLRAATGNPLIAHDFEAYLTRRYLA